MLDSYLKFKKLTITEGYSQQVPQQITDLVDLVNQVNNTNSLNVMEIGFNAGHSAEIFLSTNKDIKLTSFDLGIHEYLKTGKEYIDFTFPGRHTLILGDSKVTVNNLINSRNSGNSGNSVNFDVIFIDGGHEYLTAKADLENCRKLSHKDTIVIMDDTMFSPHWIAHWNIGPTTAWKEFVEQNKILELNRKDYSPGRGMSWGYFNLN